MVKSYYEGTAGALSVPLPIKMADTNYRILAFNGPNSNAATNNVGQDVKSETHVSAKRSEAWNSRVYPDSVQGIIWGIEGNRDTRQVL